MKLKELMALDVGDCFFYGTTTVLYILEKDTVGGIFTTITSLDYRITLLHDYEWNGLVKENFWVRNGEENSFDISELRNVEKNLKETLHKYLKPKYIKWHFKEEEEKDEDTIPIVDGDTPVGV